MILSTNTRSPLNHYYYSPSSKAHSAHNDNDEAAILDASSFDSLLRDLQPVIHYVAQFIRLAQWKGTETKYSFLLLSSWILWWTLHRFILYLLPIVLVSAKIYHGVFMSSAQHTRHRHTTLNKQALLKDLTEIRDTAYLISTIKNWMQKSDTLCRAYYRYYSIATTKRRSVICFSVACLFTMVYAGWIILLHQQMITSAASIAWFFILVIMCLHSPWVNPIYTAFVCAVIPLIHHFVIGGTTTTTTSTMSQLYTEKQDTTHEEYIIGYCFQIYHHQRWWFPTGWSNLLLPQDRPVWSDIHLESTPSIDEFRLPPTAFIGKPNEQNQQRIVSWTWIDPFWSKQQDCGDKDSWQYGSWKWKSWSSQSSGLGICTRRQKWTRYATRKESWIDIKHVSSFNEEEEEDCCDSSCSSMIGGSNTTASSTSSIYNNWDSVSPSSCSTTSTAESLPLTPILISNVSERFRRSSHSVTFNTPVLSCSQQPSPAVLEKDDMYKQFCISPKPQKLKRHSII